MAQEKNTKEILERVTTYRNNPDWSDYLKSVRVYGQKTINAYADLPAENNSITTYEMHYFKNGNEVKLDDLVKVDLSKIAFTSLSDLMNLTARVQLQRDMLKVRSVEITQEILKEKAEILKERYIYKVFIE